MSEARDYGLDGATPVQLNTSPSPMRPPHIDLEAQSPRSPIQFQRKEDKHPISPTESVRCRRPNRSNTAKTYKPEVRGRDWHPGQEPGIDPSATHPHSPLATNLRAQCDITVVDFSEDDIRVQHLDNETLPSFMDMPRPAWAACRWINVNGLSWDVIKLLGSDKHLHRLAIEDLLNPRNRTKADWYSDHTYIVLPLQKLIHFHSDTHCDSDCEEWDSDDGMTRKRKQEKGIISSFRRKKNEKNTKEPPKPLDSAAEMHTHSNGYVDPFGNRSTDAGNGFVKAHSSPIMDAPVTNVRTLQRYHGGPNEERIDFMEKHSALASKSLGVGVEQVSIFLISDNTVISFFESSAQDVESPIITRLSSRETILRRTADASMITQAIIDAIIDLAIPVAEAYQDAIGELELNVLTEADISHTTSLYVLTSEVVQFKSNLSPIVNLVNAVRDHKSDPVATPGLNGKPPKSSITISPVTQVYLGDVEDHIILVADGLGQMTHAADNMIDLIFNKNGARQNETMKQLTVVTILFLPLTFLTGYFGMNFINFTGAHNHGDGYFWEIAAPVSFVVTIYLMRNFIRHQFIRKMQRRGINQSRKKRQAKQEYETKQKRH
ncbi:MAG: hypothetical protein Q9175_003875 [Cornicularia normoerica]